MKIERIQSGKTRTFEGKRLDKNAVSQLIKNNPYSLNDINQRYISNAIERLAKVSGDKNIQFLLDTAAKLKYSTSITLEDLPKNDWKNKLLTAAGAAIAITPLADGKFSESITNISNNTTLSNEEQEILSQRQFLLEGIDLEQINSQTNGTVKNFKKNLDYFIISSETTLEHKKYVLERLNYLMSDKYEINPQLKDKKSIVAAEIINDLAINVPGNEIPNIKAINQKQHGMCAAISIVRKKLAYEDKPNFVDSILSELDATDKISVYDRSCLGSGKKVDVYKVPVDFDSAIAKGYRIIDASTMHWMQIAHMSGQNNLSYNVYTPFDNNNFGVKTDSFFNAPLANEELEKTQRYYQALLKAKSVIERYKASKIKRDVKNQEILQKREQNIKDTTRIGKIIKNELHNIDPSISDNQTQKIYGDILNLEKPLSKKIKSGDKYSYIPNEEEFVKKEKIKKYILANTNAKDIKNESIEKLYFMINRYHELNKSINTPSMFSKASSLFKLAAAFRYQIITGLDDKQILSDTMHAEGIPNKESLILNTINTLIHEIETNSSKSNLIIKQMAPDTSDRSETLSLLYQIKESFTKSITEDLDKIYASLTIGGRKEALLTYLESLRNTIEDGDTSLIKSLSEELGVKKSPTKILKVLNTDIEKLQTGNEKEYLKLFDKYGTSSQIDHLQNIFDDFIQKSASGDNEEIIMSFLETNNLKIEDGTEAFTAKLEEISTQIQIIKNDIDLITNILRIVDENGNTLFSADPKEFIIKKLENDNRMVNSKQLKDLEIHLDKILKEKSSDEFQTQRGKIKDKNLLKFSNSEKILLKDIDQSVDIMYSYVKKQLNHVYSDMRFYIEELARISGVNNGRYWVGEGDSGLYKEQPIRVLEYITGRPYYATENIKNAIDKIKTSPYSGISGSSVYHFDNGGHAQYVADIEPVTIKTEDGKNETKDVLFLDNTWGACEKDNTWTDSSGLTRTDYSDRRGGSLGYITNSKYRNGNFVDRILSDMVVKVTPETVENKFYKKVTNDSDWSYPQYYEMILEGTSPDIRKISDELHDALFSEDIKTNINLIQKLGNNSTENELQAIITNNKYSGLSWKDTYNKLMGRINPLFGNGIRTKEEYDKLPDDDYLKVALEKTALKNNASIGGSGDDLAKVRDIKKFSKFRTAQKNRAINNFKYAFSKTYATIDYLADSFGEKESNKIDTILDKYNIKLTDEELNTIGAEFSIDKDIFDGSAKTTINLLMNTINQDLDKVITNPEAKQELADFFLNYFNEKLYFNKDDLDMSKLDNQKISNIINFIDRVYDPYDDEEFVEIYRQIQDMTEEEFKQEILSKATYEDMGVKSTTGYDILKKIQRAEEKAETDFMNTVYYDFLVNESTKEKLQPKYEYDKFTRKSKFLYKKDINSFYRDLKFDLSLLDLPKLFNKYKDQNYKKYGKNPSYPQIERLSRKYLETSFNSSLSVIENDINTISNMKRQIRNYEIADLFQKLKGEASEDLIIDENNYANLNNLFGEIITINSGDADLKEIKETAEKAIEIEEGHSLTEYLPYINTIIEQINEFKKAAPIEHLNNIIENCKKEMKAQNLAFSKSLIQTKYQNNIEEKLNKYEQAVIKFDINKAESIKNELFQDFEKYHILNNTQELLEKFILSCAEDSELKQYNEIYSKVLEHALEYAKLMEIQEIIMGALQDGIAINAKDGFGKHSINFNTGEFSMNSDTAITYIANSLILDDKFETALMFLEKLGLNEQYVNYMVKNIDYDKINDVITESYTITQNYISFKHDIAQDFEIAEMALSDPNNDYGAILDNLNKAIIDKGAACSLNETDLADLLNGIETVKYNCDINLTNKKGIIFATIMSEAKNNFTANIANQVEAKSTILNANSTIFNFINNIMLPEDTETAKAREDANNKFQVLMELNDTYANLLEQENSDKI